MRALLKRLRYLLPGYRRAREFDMQQELASLAKLAGLDELGNLTRVAEDGRAAMGLPLLQALGSDLRYSLRGLRKDKAFTAVAILSLAFGVATNVSIFGLMDALLWRELPVSDPSQLVSFENTSRSYFGYTEFAKHSSGALQGVVAQSPVFGTNVDLGSSPIPAQSEFVSDNYFDLLGTKAAYGRLLSPANASDRVAVLSYNFWQRAWNRDPAAVGKSIYVGVARFEVIGVAPDGFFGLSVGEAPDIWLPVTAHSSVFAGEDWLKQQNTNWLNLFGRLEAGVSAARAEAMLTPVSVEIDIERSGTLPTAAERREMLEDHIRLVPAAKGISALRDRFSKPLHVLFGMLAAGLLLACINVISLQLARADERGRQFALRLAIGASRFRILRQCLVETLVIATASGVLGCLLFGPLTTSIVSLMTIWGGDTARLDMGFHPELVAFVILLCLGITLVAGLIPAIYSNRSDIHSLMKTAGASPRRRRLLIRAVVSAQLAVAVLVITGSGILIFSLHQLRHFDSGVKRNGLFQFNINTSNSVQQDARLGDRFAAIPEAESVSFSQNGIYSGRNFGGSFQADGFQPANDASHFGIWDDVGPNFFHTVGTTIVAGRDFDGGDNKAAAKVVIVNETFARRVFPNRSPLGQILYIEKAAYRIIGVVRDVRSNLREARLEWYFPALQHDDHPFTTSFLIRARSSDAALFLDIKNAAGKEKGSIAAGTLKSADALMDGTLDTDRLMARLAWIFGMLSLWLAAVGVYGLVFYDLTKRTAEFGIRAALGAMRWDLIQIAVGEALLVAVLGVSTGGILTAVTCGVLRGLVFDMDVTDPRFGLAGAGILLTVTLLAAAIPARHASKLDPAQALRTE
jgi:predicted permease